MTDPRSKRPDEVDEASEESFPASDPPGWTGVLGTHADSVPGARAAAGDDEVNVENNEEASLFEVREPEGVAELRYRLRRNGTLVLIHTEVPPALNGRGIGGKLAKTALEFARDRGLVVVPLCPFVAKYIERHPEFKDLVRSRS